MNYEQNITIGAVIIVTLVVLWYVDKEIKILRSDVVNMKEALSINVQMFQKLRNAYQAISVGLRPSNRPTRKEIETDTEAECAPESAPELAPQSVRQLETINETEEEPESESVPLPVNDVPPQKETTVKKRSRKKLPAEVV